MIAVLLAISKTGATYLPLDPIYPKARQELILEDCQATPVSYSKIIYLIKYLSQMQGSSSSMKKKKYNNGTANNLPFGDALKPLYILFTSGSTGKTKRCAPSFNVQQSMWSIPFQRC